MNDKYTLQIFWSAEDQAFVAVCQEFSGLSALGETREDALHEAESALNLMLETYLAKGIELPKPPPVPLAA